MPLRFSRPLRVRKSGDFERAYARKCKAADGVILLFAVRNDLAETRLGLSVSRRRGGAVQRNRQKRRLREAFRHVQHELPRGLDLIAIPIHPGPPSMGAYQESFRKLARKLDRKLNENAPESSR